MEIVWDKKYKVLGSIGLKEVLDFVGVGTWNLFIVFSSCIYRQVFHPQSPGASSFRKITPECPMLPPSMAAIGGYSKSWSY